MNTTYMMRGLVLVLAAGLLTACDNRGEFGSEACAKGDRVDVGGSAVGAIYVDKDGKSLAAGEELKGTVKNKMCPTPDPGGGGGCPGGYCARTYQGVTYCLRC